MSTYLSIRQRQGTGRNRAMTGERIIIFLSLTRQNDK
jgi:hypothetical protein